MSKFKSWTRYYKQFFLWLKHKIVIKFLIVLLLALVSWSSYAYAAVKIDAKFEEKVLQIIKNNPEVLIESIQVYQQEQKVKKEQERQAFLQELKTNSTQIIGDSPTKGAKNAQIILAEFSDFQCPFCAKATETIDAFMSKHGNEVQLVYKHFPLVSIHDQAIPAAESAWAAYQQGKFWEYHDGLFRGQNKLGDEFYLELAKSLNLNLEKFKSDRNKASQEIIKDIEIANKLGIKGTPYFIMNGEMFFGSLKLEDFEKILEKVK